MTTPLPQNLRLLDLIAKTARVTLKDTARVIHAVDAVTKLYGPEAANPPVLVSSISAERPSPENIAACEQASFALREGDNPCQDEIDKRLDAIRQL